MQTRSRPTSLLLLVIKRPTPVGRPRLSIGVLVAAVVLALLRVADADAGGYTDASYLTPRGRVGQAYSHRVEWKPGNGCPPYTYAVVGGDFPPGLRLSTDGYLSGTPTAGGRYSFYIRQTDMCGPEGEGNSPFVITVDPVTPPPPPPPPLAVVGGALPTAEATVPYAATLSATGGSGARSWSVTGGQMPPGLTLSSDGRISGTPQAGGSFGFDATVSAAGSTVTARFVLVIVPGLAVSLGVAPILEVRRPFAAKLADVLPVTGGTPPYRYAPVGGFPFGVGLEPETGSLFGSPRRSGTLALTIRVSDAKGAMIDTALSLEVLERLRLAIGKLPQPHPGRRYRARLRATGGTGVVWRITSGSLPSGLVLDVATGAITGTPRRREVVRFAVSARDALGAAVSTRLRLTVA